MILSNSKKIFALESKFSVGKRIFCLQILLMDSEKSRRNCCQRDQKFAIYSKYQKNDFKRIFTLK